MERVKFPTVVFKLLFWAISLSFYPHLLPPLSLSVQAGAEAPKCCRGHARNPIHCQCSAVNWADIVLIRFPLSEVTELGESQLLRLYFSSGGEGHMACGIAILSLLLCGLSPDQGREGSGEVAAEQSLLWRNI